MTVPRISSVVTAVVMPSKVMKPPKTRPSTHVSDASLVRIDIPTGHLLTCFEPGLCFRPTIHLDYLLSVTTALA